MPTAASMRGYESARTVPRATDPASESAELESDLCPAVLGGLRTGRSAFTQGGSNAEVSIRIVAGEPVLDWGSSFSSALIPVGPSEFLDRQFWARLVMNRDPAGFTYSTSGREFKARCVPGT